MPTVRLGEESQSAVSALLALEPVPGDGLTVPRTLATISRLIPCDVAGVIVEDSGRVVGATWFPTRMRLRPADLCPGTAPIGLTHQGDDPGQRRVLSGRGMTDGLLWGFRSSRDRIVHLSLARRHRRFTDSDVALLRMMLPWLAKLLRDDPAPTPRVTLTSQERRVLQLLATGMSNPDIAARMCVAPSTVRKHLEHVFRKLGVSNRLAAVQAFEGRLAAGSTVPDEIFA